MKLKLLISAVILSSLFGYLEWGKDNHSFLFQVELELFSKLLTAPLSVIHPFVIMPLCGQLILTITLFQKKPAKVLILLGILGLSLLLWLMFFIGIISQNFKIILSVLPFMIFSILTVLELRK